MSETTDKATIFTSRRECLIESVGDSRRVWSVHVWSGAEPDDAVTVFWGLARTEHQFRMAVADLIMGQAMPYSKDQLQAAMADEMKAMAKGGDQ